MGSICAVGVLALAGIDGAAPASASAEHLSAFVHCPSGSGVDQYHGSAVDLPRSQGVDTYFRLVYQNWDEPIQYSSIVGERTMRTSATGSLITPVYTMDQDNQYFGIRFYVSVPKPYDVTYHSSNAYCAGETP